jgi:hypothetical protein
LNLEALMRLPWLACALLVLGMACEEQPPEEERGAGDGGFLGGLIGGGAAGGTTGGGTGGTAGGGVTGGAVQGGVQGGVAGGGVQGGGVQGGGVGGGSGNGLPCDVSAVLRDKCQTCHGNPLMSGPMPLITWADLQAISPAYAGTKIAARVKARIHNTAAPMPPAGRPALTSAELATLDAYLDAGAPQTNVACSGGAVTGGGGTTGGGAATGGGATTGGATTGGGLGGSGFGVYVPPDSECDYIQEFRAHASQSPNDNTPFEPPQGTDLYEIFFFTPKWTEKVQTIRVDPIIDNGAVLHHWLLYMEDGDGSGDGTHRQGVGIQSPSAQLLSGWAPGNENLGLGRVVGLETVSGPNARFGIEIHYNTTANPPNRRDRSGARICVTSKLRPKTASTHWLGTQAILNIGFAESYEASGVCTVVQEAHIIAMSPHMHRNGRYMKTIIQHAAGGTSTITDKPFSFDDQQVFPIDSPTGEIVTRPGDVITTTCTYDGLLPFVFGANTDMEMCYNFVVAWPAGSLSNGVPGFVGGKNTCIDGIL